jgi:uncharacterized membrane protein (DUF373 family)
MGMDEYLSPSVSERKDDGMRVQTLVQKLAARFQRLVIASLILLMAVTVFLSILDTGLWLINNLVLSPILLVDASELLDILGFLLLVLIDLKLLETFRIYLKERVIHMEAVFMVAMIAVVCKVIVLDVKESPSTTLLGITSVIITLSGAYYLFRRAGWGKCLQETEEVEERLEEA